MKQRASICRASICEYIYARIYPHRIRMRGWEKSRLGLSGPLIHIKITRSKALLGLGVVSCQCDGKQFSAVSHCGLSQKSALKNQPTVSNSSNSIVLTFLKNWLQKLRLDCFEHVMSLARRFLEQAGLGVPSFSLCVNVSYCEAKIACISFKFTSSGSSLSSSNVWHASVCQHCTTTSHQHNIIRSEKQKPIQNSACTDVHPKP